MQSLRNHWFQTKLLLDPAMLVLISVDFGVAYFGHTKIIILVVKIAQLYKDNTVHQKKKNLIVYFFIKWNTISFIVHKSNGDYTKTKGKVSLYSELYLSLFLFIIAVHEITGFQSSNDLMS